MGTWSRFRHSMPLRSRARLVWVWRCVSASAVALWLAHDVSASDGSLPRLIVATDALDQSWLQAFQIGAPFSAITNPLATRGDVLVRVVDGRVLVLSRQGATLGVLHDTDWRMGREYALGVGTAPADVALLDCDRVLISDSHASRMRVLELGSGYLRPSIDLGSLDGQGTVVGANRMVRMHDRWFVQVRMADGHPPLLAVVDARTEAMIDASPSLPGMQAILLSGTAPKFDMNVDPGANILYVGATGHEADAGGIEAVDTRGLTSLGLVVRESEGRTGADLGAFVMSSTEGGYLTFTTDWTLSSHLTSFTLAEGPSLGELGVMVDYFVPVLVHVLQAQTFFMPYGGAGDIGVRPFDSTTGKALSPAPIPTVGTPTHLAFDPRTASACPGQFDTLFTDGFEIDAFGRPVSHPHQERGG